MVDIYSSLGILMRQHLISASLVLSLFVFAGCSAGDGTGVTAAPAAGDAPQAGAAADNNGGGNCKAYMAEVRNVCLDSITRGLDMSCDSQFIAVEMVQTQAAGALFDVGSDTSNAEVAESVCASYLKSLQKKRQRKDADMHADSGAWPTCTALAEKFDTACLRELGHQPIPDKCRSATRMLNALKSQPAEDRCAQADNQMK